MAEHRKRGTGTLRSAGAIAVSWAKNTERMGDSLVARVTNNTDESLQVETLLEAFGPGGERLAKSLETIRLEPSGTKAQTWERAVEFAMSPIQSAGVATQWRVVALFDKRSPDGSIRGARARSDARYLTWSTDGSIAAVRSAKEQLQHDTERLLSGTPPRLEVLRMEDAQGRPIEQSTHDRAIVFGASIPAELAQKNHTIPNFGEIYAPASLQGTTQTEGESAP